MWYWWTQRSLLINWADMNTGVPFQELAHHIDTLITPFSDHTLSDHIPHPLALSAGSAFMYLHLCNSASATRQAPERLYASHRLIHTSCCPLTCHVKPACYNVQQMGAGLMLTGGYVVLVCLHLHFKSNMHA